MVSNARVPRAVYVEQSVQTFIRASVLSRGFPETQIEFRDDFEQRTLEAEKQLTKDYVAMGFNFDEGGRSLEMGSDLTEYEHHIEIFVIAQAADRGRALAYAIREDLEAAAAVPLLDILQSPPPQFDTMIVSTVKVERQVTADPLPWQEFAWLVTLVISDEFYPSGW
jgi:hypothetical protein